MSRHIAEAAPDEELSYYHASLKQYIDECGKRHTPERHIVLDAMESFKGRFSIDALMQILGKGLDRVSRGTVVNTVQLMQRAGLLVEVGVQDRCMLYQLVPRQLRKSKIQRIPISIGMQCKNCGEVKEVRDRQAVAPLASRRYRGFVPASGIVTIYGLCEKCMDTLGFNKKLKK